MIEDDETTPENEGVRLLGADEAAKALDRDDIARRRKGDEPRYGDRPESTRADGPRPSIRFPLSDDDDGRPSQRRGVGADTTLPHWTDPPTGEVPRIFGSNDDADGDSWSGFSSGQPRWRGEGPEREDEFDDFSRLADDETRVGALRSDDDRPHPDAFFDFDDEPEEEEEGWDDYNDVVAPLTAPGIFEPGYDDEEWYEDEVPAPRRPGTQTITSDPRRAARSARPEVFERPETAGRNVGTAAMVGAGFLAVAFICFLLGPMLTVGFIAVILTVAVLELFTVMRSGGYQPAVLLGTAATFMLPVAAYNWGDAGVSVVMFLLVIFGMLWYLAGAGEDDRPVIGLSSTLLGVGWVGVLGSSAALIMALPMAKGVGSPGTGILIVAVLATVAYDTGGFFIGRNMGRTPLSEASPNKTVEGLVGGALVSIVVTMIVTSLVAPLSELDLIARLFLAAVIAVVAPFGDLSESVLKRDFGVKDMGSILPGHGGLLDRFDAMLFVLPTVYCLARVLLY